jgi:polar amino acid transport system substrate-binding protein
MFRQAVGAAFSQTFFEGPRARGVTIKSAGKDGGMSNRKTYILAALLVLVVVAMVGAAACGSSSGGGSSASPSAAPTSAADIAQQILGKAPTGLAGEIIANGTMVVANDANYAPQSSVDKATGDLVGFDVDVANKVGEILGLKVEFKNPDWATIPTGLSQGRYDVSIGSMTSAIDGDKAADATLVSRWKAMDFTEPYYYTSGQLFVKKGGEQVPGPADLAGKKVGVGASTTYYSWLKDNTDADIKIYTTDADAFPDLRNGNIDFVMTAGPTGQQAISQGQPFDFSGAPLYYEDLSMAVKKGEGDWVALLNYAVAKMHEDGSLTAMSEKWYSGLDLTVKE